MTANRMIEAEKKKTCIKLDYMFIEAGELGNCSRQYEELSHKFIFKRNAQRNAPPTASLLAVAFVKRQHTACDGPQTPTPTPTTDRHRLSNILVVYAQHPLKERSLQLRPLFHSAWDFSAMCKHLPPKSKLILAAVAVAAAAWALRQVQTR